jgi:transposase
LPVNQPGPERKDDRRILSGGCRSKDCPSEYGPHKTIYNRFAQWSERGVWQKMFAAVAGDPDVLGHLALDSSHVKIHRCASGGKGGTPCVSSRCWPIGFDGQVYQLAPQRRNVLDFS